MSLLWITHVWERSPYKGVGLLVHLALADHANDQGTCFPHLPTIIRKSRSSRTAVYRALAQMRDDGLLTYEGAEVGRPNPDTPLSLHRVPERDGTVPDWDAPVPNRDSEAGYTSSIEPSVEPSSNPTRAVTDVTQEFEYWWTHYPKRVGKGAARAAYGRALKKVGTERLLEAVQGYAASRRGQDKQYTLNPTTWLNQERWDDEIAPSRIGVLPDAPMPDWMKKIAKEQP